MAAIIEVRDLVKQYRGVRAVDGVSFGIEPGTCFGLLGPNGAGKTTTVEMLEGIQAPTSGAVLFQGRPLDAQFRLEAGIMFQSTALQEFITVRETLELFAHFYPRTADIEQLIEKCNLASFLDRDTRRLSGGQRQRLLLAIALVNDPAVVFLDEPTTGLDPQARRNLWHLVEEITEQGKTVILTTHYMEEAYVLCDEIAIMDRGRIVTQGSPKGLLAAHFGDQVVELPLEAVPAGLPLEHLVCGASVQILTHDVEQTVRTLLAHGVALGGLKVRERTLDDLFLELTGKELRG